MWFADVEAGLATDEFISWDEAFEFLCEKAGAHGRSTQVQHGTMHSYGYDPCAEGLDTDDDRQQHRLIHHWLKKIGFTEQKFSRANFEKLVKYFPNFPQLPEARDPELVPAPTKTFDELVAELPSLKRVVNEAVMGIWPDGIPPGGIKRRNELIRQYQRKHGLDVTSDSTIKRYFKEDYNRLRVAAAGSQKLSKAVADPALVG